MIDPGASWFPFVAFPLFGVFLMSMGRISDWLRKCEEPIGKPSNENGCGCDDPLTFAQEQLLSLVNLAYEWAYKQAVAESEEAGFQ
jgi:hypothetical protein